MSDTDKIDPRLLCRCCGKLHPGARLVTLPDGQVIGNYSEEHRAYHEAVMVVKMERKSDRVKYLNGVKSKRGVESASKLRDDVIYWWDIVRPPSR